MEIINFGREKGAVTYGVIYPFITYEVRIARPPIFGKAVLQNEEVIKVLE